MPSLQELQKAVAELNSVIEFETPLIVNDDESKMIQQLKEASSIIEAPDDLSIETIKTILEIDGTLPQEMVDEYNSVMEEAESSIEESEEEILEEELLEEELEEEILEEKKPKNKPKKKPTKSKEKEILEPIEEIVEEEEKEEMELPKDVNSKELSAVCKEVNEKLKVKIRYVGVKKNNILSSLHEELKNQGAKLNLKKFSKETQNFLKCFPFLNDGSAKVEKPKKETAKKKEEKKTDKKETKKTVKEKVVKEKVKKEPKPKVEKEKKIEKPKKEKVKKEKKESTPSNKMLVYKAWTSDRSKTSEQLHKEIKEAVLLTTINWWISQWKKDEPLNIPTR